MKCDSRNTDQNVPYNKCMSLMCIWNCPINSNQTELNKHCNIIEKHSIMFANHVHNTVSSLQLFTYRVFQAKNIGIQGIWTNFQIYNSKKLILNYSTICFKNLICPKKVWQVYMHSTLLAKIEPNLKKILQKNRRRHFDKCDALIWKLVSISFLIGVQGR